MVRVVVLGAPPLTLARQCARAFEREGHETRYINYRFLNAHRFSLTNRLLNAHIIRVCRRFKPNLVLTVKGESLLPGTIKTLREQGAYTMDWVIDEPTGKYYPTGRITNLHEYDHAISFDRAYVELIKKLGAPRVDFLPIGVDETVFTEKVPLAQRNYLCDTSFIGTYWPEREHLFGHIANTDLRIYGQQWRKKLAKNSPLKNKVQRIVLNGPAMCKYFNLSKINLNQTHLQAVDGGINLRIPEVLATRSFLLTNALKGQEELFQSGKELVTYTTHEDFVQKIHYYLAHPEERDAIAENGYRRILKEHTLRHRVRTILALAKLPT